MRQGEIGPSFAVLMEAPSIRFVRRQGLELDEAPGDVIGALIREKVAHQMATAARNDPAPAIRVGLEGRALEWVDLVPNQARDAHREVAPGHAPDSIVRTCSHAMVRLRSNHERRPE